MQKLLSTLLFLVLAPLVVLAQNKYPIVLVHGFLGWGRDELNGLKYWGGIQGDLQEQLKAQGYTVYTAAVGPFSSTWDRACELYAQIKGGQVDYGAKHSTTHGHTRLGRTFPGLYPKWGDVENGKVNKIHLIGHSMGGQTARMLTQLLNKGSAGAPIVEDATSNALFAGGKDWVHSITTISAPNQGTTIANGFSDIGDTVKGMIVNVLSLAGTLGPGTQTFYDAKLDQWGLTPKAMGETIHDYIHRIFRSSIFRPGFKDVTLWSASTDGAAEESTWVQTLPNVYYFSYSTSDTFAWHDILFRRVHLPNTLTMLLPLDPLAVFMGGRYPVANGLTEDWQENDGVVPTFSMAKDATGELVVYNGTAQKGKWNYMIPLKRMDHLAILGLTLHTQVKDLYFVHAQMLESLPTDAGDAAATGLSDAALNALVGGTVTALSAAAERFQSIDDVKQFCEHPSTLLAAKYCIQVIRGANHHRFLRGTHD